MFKRLKDLAKDLVPALRDYRVTKSPQGDTLLHTMLVLANGKKLDLYLREYKSRRDAAEAGGRVYAFLRKEYDFKRECEIEMFSRSHGFKRFWGPWVWPEGADDLVPVRLELPSPSQGVECQISN